MGFKRKGSRVEVSRGGRLQRGALSAPCKVLDVHIFDDHVQSSFSRR